MNPFASVISASSLGRGNGWGSPDTIRPMGRGGPWATRAMSENPNGFRWPGHLFIGIMMLMKMIFMEVAIGIDAYFVLCRW